jgi:hypothetical protein
MSAGDDHRQYRVPRTCVCVLSSCSQGRVCACVCDIGAISAGEDHRQYRVLKDAYRVLKDAYVYVLSFVFSRTYVCDIGAILAGEDHHAPREVGGDRL